MKKKFSLLIFCRAARHIEERILAEGHMFDVTDRQHIEKERPKSCDLTTVIKKAKDNFKREERLASERRYAAM